MIPIDQFQRLEKELDSMTLDGLKALQCLNDNILYKSIQEGLKINRYATRRSVTRNIPLTDIRSMIQEAILDKVYDEIAANMTN